MGEKKPHPIVTSLRDIRRDLKISQEAIGAVIGRNGQSLVSEYEHGIHSPRLVTVSKWADALGYEFVLRPKDRQTF